MACCARPTPFRRIDAPAVGASLLHVHRRLFRRVRRRHRLHPALDVAVRRILPMTAERRARGPCAPPASRRQFRSRGSAATAMGSARHDVRPSFHLGRPHRFLGAGLCASSMASISASASCSPSVHGEGDRDTHDELRRAGVGRQRDLAGARRRRPVRRLSARLRRSSCRRSTCRSSSCCWRSSFAASPSSSAGAPSATANATYGTTAFAGGSIVAAIAQGIALGALVQGIPVSGRAYAGGWWDWLTPFSILTGIALVVGYALLGVDMAHHEDHRRLAAARLPAWRGGLGSARWR